MPMHPSQLQHHQHPGNDERRWQLIYANQWTGAIGAVEVREGVTAPMRTAHARTMCAAQGGSLRLAFCLDEHDGVTDAFVAGDFGEEFVTDLLSYVYEKQAQSDLDVALCFPPRLFAGNVSEPECRWSTLDWQESIAGRRAEDAQIDEAMRELNAETVRPDAGAQEPAGGTDAAAATDAPTVDLDAHGAAALASDEPPAPEGEFVKPEPEPIRAQLSFCEGMTKAQLDGWAMRELGLVLDGRKARDAMLADIIRCPRFVLVDGNGEPVKVEA